MTQAHEIIIAQVRRAVQLWETVRLDHPQDPGEAIGLYGRAMEVFCDLVEFSLGYDEDLMERFTGESPRGFALNPDWNWEHRLDLAATWFSRLEMHGRIVWAWGKDATTRGPVPSGVWERFMEAHDALSRLLCHGELLEHSMVMSGVAGLVAGHNPAAS